MINGQLKSDIDKLWDDFWSGGIANPLSVIEQISFLMFARLLDIRETREENKAKRTGKPFRRIFSEKPIQDEVRRTQLVNLVQTEQDLRWSSFRKENAENMLRIVRDGVFPHFKTVAMDGAHFGEYMKDAQLLVHKPNLLVIAVNTIDKLPLTSGDTKGDLYEYMLGKLSTAGIAGQFRTPRHIITKMVEMLAPRPDEVIGDPACGTAGFLVQTMHYLQKEYTTPGMEYLDEEGNLIYPGDKLEPYRDHIQSGLLHGFDFDATMLRIAAMNLLLHNIDVPAIHYMDTLSNRFPESKELGRFSADFFDVVLANPPFKGSLDYDDVHPSLLKKVKTKKTELLFVTLILKILKTGGRSATIVPDGVLFGSSKAHLALRKILVDNNQLEAVISLPSGVFKPYAGVSTAIIVFTKGGRTDNVFFYDVQSDGFSLDDKREAQPDKDDLSEMLARWQARNPTQDTNRTKKHFFVSASDIRENKYDFSINHYKETVYEEEEYDPPKEILGRMMGLEKEIMADMEELRGDVGMRRYKLGDVLEQYDKRLGNQPEPIVLTLTEKHGFVSQQERFKKRLAIDDTSKYKIVQQYDIAFNPYLLWAGAIAQNIDWEIGIISPVYPTFKVKKDFDPRFVNYRIHSETMRLQYETISFGAVPRRRRAAVDRFLELDAGLFPLFSEQRRIAAILDKADAIRRKRQVAIKLADDFLRATFLDMFGDPFTNPKGWKTFPLKYFGEITTGNTPLRAKPDYYGYAIEWIKSDNINTHYHFLTKATEGLSAQGKKVARTVPAFSTLITCIAGSFGCIGNAALSDREVAFNQQINAITPREGIDPFFLYGLILYGKKIIQNASTNSMKGMVSKGKLEQVLFIYPPGPLQRRFGTLFKRLIASDDNRHGAEMLSNDLFNSLTQRGFRGEL